MEKIYIFGHQRPDTDSVTSAIALSYLKNTLGFNTEPRVLGEVNRETQFVLDYFGVKVPKLLNDVKLQLKDLNYHKNYAMNQDASIGEVYQYLLDKGTDTKYGARPLRRAIQRYLEDELSDKILRSELTNGNTVKVDLNENKLVFDISK